jgi:hypothetical protein
VVVEPHEHALAMVHVGLGRGTDCHLWRAQVAASGLKVQAVMSFHAAGGNVGDTCRISLPRCASSSPAMCLLPSHLTLPAWKVLFKKIAHDSVAMSQDA